MVALEQENADVKARLDARILTDRAKGSLMDNHSMSEAESWRFLQKTAMNSRRSLADVARDVIAGALVP